MVHSQSAPRLIASDIDGTLLDRNHRVTRRNREAIARAVSAGAYFALSTGRPFRWIAPVLEQLTVRPVCVTSNGAVIYDSAADTILSAHELQPAAISDVIAVAQEALAPYGEWGLAPSAPVPRWRTQSKSSLWWSPTIQRMRSLTDLAS